jgi:pyruvyl transferase EpsO
MNVATTGEQNENLAAHRVLMAQLASRHAPLADLLAGTVDYVDLPMYGNVGDLLIMAGTLEFFATHNIRPRRFATYFNYGAKTCPSGTTIACQGGGIFGDIYGPFQAFRERLISARRNCRIVVLPQSIHFSSAARLDACVQICRKHPDLHICVRDFESQALAREMTDHVYLLPDMAHQLWGEIPVVQGQGPILTLRRRDQESSTSSVIDSEGAFDWDDLVSPAERAFLSGVVERVVTQFELRLGSGHLFGNWFAQWWIARANRLNLQAVSLFRKHGSVVSDRLHAHILACLMEMPNTIYDNSYGKNSRYMRAWTGASPLVTAIPFSQQADKT